MENSKKFYKSKVGKTDNEYSSSPNDCLGLGDDNEKDTDNSYYENDYPDIETTRSSVRKSRGKIGLKSSGRENKDEKEISLREALKNKEWYIRNEQQKQFLKDEEEQKNYSRKLHNQKLNRPTKETLKLFQNNSEYLKKIKHNIELTSYHNQRHIENIQKNLPKLGYEFDDWELCQKALTHPSFPYCGAEHNGLLQILGEKIVRLVIIRTLGENFPETAKSRWFVVSNQRKFTSYPHIIHMVLPKTSLKEYIRYAAKTQIEEDASLVASLFSFCAILEMEKGYLAAETYIKNIFLSELMVHVNMNSSPIPRGFDL